MFICYNHTILPQESINLGISNRAFAFGDGFFESVHVDQGKAILLNLHFDRINNALSFFKMPLNTALNLHSLEQLIAQLYVANNFMGKCRAKLTFFRNGEGQYTTQENSSSFLIKLEPLPVNEVLAQSVNCGIASSISKPISPIWSFKSLNASIYIMAGLECQSKGMQDLLLLNQHGHICEAVASNVFFIKGNTIFTPPLSSGCVDGVMRKFILTTLHLNITETDIMPHELLNFDEIWLSNAVKGLRWVNALNGKIYGNNLFNKIAEKMPF